MFVVIEKVDLNAVQSYDLMIDKSGLLSQYSGNVEVQSYVESLYLLKNSLASLGATNVLYLFKSGYVVSGTQQILPYQVPTSSGAEETTLYTVSHYTTDEWSAMTNTQEYADYISSRLSAAPIINWTFHGYKTGPVDTEVADYDAAESVYSSL